MIAADLADMKRGGDKPSEHDLNFDSANLPDGISQSQAAQMMGVSERSIRDAIYIKENDPEIAQQAREY